MFPDKLVIQKDIPTRLHNISLIAQHRVSVDPFSFPDDFNVKPGEIAIVEFTPNSAGEFTIFHEIHGITGKLIVEEHQ